VQCKFDYSNRQCNGNINSQCEAASSVKEGFCGSCGMN
jgi:hypothetical protein